MDMTRRRLGTMEEYVIKSFYLQEEMPLKIFKSEHFSLDQMYNICIVHDGDHYFQLGRLATLSDEMHKENKIEQTVFVGILFITRKERRMIYHLDGVLNEAYTYFPVS